MASAHFSHSHEYSKELSKHRNILPIYALDVKQQNAYIAPSATVVGEVVLARFSQVWYNAVVRGDINNVYVGYHSSIGENTVVHTAASLPTG